jgi:type IV pilus assembly protein PilX
MSHHTSIRSQSGAVLIVSLLFLVVLTMLGVTAMTGTTFEERMAGNARDAAVAQHSAEAALRKARDTILGLGGSPAPLEGNFNKTTDPAGLCEAGLCTPRPYVRDVGTVPPEIPAAVTWSETADSGGTTKPYATGSAADRLRGVSKQSRYIIEMFCLPLLNGGLGGVADACRVWRFTAVGWGKNPNTQVTVQEVYISDKRSGTN